MTTRKYTSRSQQTTLTGSVTSGATIIPVVSATTLLGAATVSTGQTFTVVIDPDTALEEVVDVTAISSNNLTITRAIDGSSAQDHSAGAVVRHMIIGRDLREANTHIEASNGVHGLASTSSVVGTQDTQTLYNKTLIAPVLTATTENDAGISFQGTTVDAYATTLSVVDPTANRTITLPNTSGTVVLQDSTDTLTNKTITSPTINGTPVITGLSSAGMVNSSATPKIYVDSILGSATAASTSAASAATSAASAATSASSSATSAASALTSAASALTSQTAAATSAASAATSASSALTSQTAAATSATSSAASATAAATSATSAAASATTAAASVASIITYANNAATSAASAATSASSAATSASSAAASAASMAASVAAAATSATSAAASATAAATSATSSAASATAAATSATSAAASQTAAATSATSSATSASAALTSANNAATSASSALTSQTAAATSAASAAVSATSSATSASSSLATYNQYKTEYLGTKTSAPTLDNQGNTLIVGATYFNSTTNTMYVWNGSAWTAISTTGYSAPTLGTTALTSGTTISSVAGLSSLALNYTGSSTNVGTLSVGGATSITDTGLMATFVGNASTYAYQLTQNTSSGTSSYTTVTAANNGYAAYVSMGVNSTTYSSTSAGFPNNAFSMPNANFLEADNGDLAIGTWSNNPIHFVVNGQSATADSLTISSSTVTVPSLTLTGSLTAGGSAGTSGYYLQTTGTGVQWAAVAGYTAPTLGTTVVTSGTTISTINGLTKIVSATHASLDANSYEQDITLMTIMGAWL